MQLVESGYLLTPTEDPESLKDKFADRLASLDLAGTLILAPEGLNWSLFGHSSALDQFANALKGFDLDGQPRFTRTGSDSSPFNELKLRIRPELVTSGLNPELLPKGAGTHVAPEDFNALLDEPEVRLIDVRNSYEISIGSFTEAVNPQIENFVEFPEFVESELESEDRSAPIALCCTGGIRCERASQYLLSQGFERVYQLSGGILAYLESVPTNQRRFVGECFVFDGRVSLTSELEPGNYQLNGPVIEPKHYSDREAVPSMSASTSQTASRIKG